MQKIGEPVSKYLSVLISLVSTEYNDLNLEGTNGGSPFEIVSLPIENVFQGKLRRNAIDDVQS